MIDPKLTYLSAGGIFVTNSSSFSLWLKHAMAPQLVKRSIKTAILVGSILNLINQGPAIWGDDEINWTNLLLTFLVPYCVSTYSGAMSAIGNLSQDKNT